MVGRWLICLGGSLPAYARLCDSFAECQPVAAGYLDHEVAQAPWMVCKAGDDPRAVGGALLVQFVKRS